MCIYFKINCGFFWEAWIVATKKLVEALAVPVVAVEVTDGAAATVCYCDNIKFNVEDSPTTKTTVKGWKAAATKV